MARRVRVVATEDATPSQIMASISCRLVRLEVATFHLCGMMLLALTDQRPDADDLERVYADLERFVEEIADESEAFKKLRDRLDFLHSPE